MRPPPRPDPYPVEPLAGPIDATVTVPGSKSLTNRALICAALATGTSTLEGALFADDTEAMMAALGQLAVGIDPAPEQHRVDARLSGTTARFVAPLLGLGLGRYRLDGSDPLRRRSMAPMIEVMRDAGVEVVEEGEPGHLPIRLRGWRQWPSEVSVDASVSSQFVSGLLMAAPYFSSRARTST
jgi:3-phosphoshikimate 1-carboxyvinyltransferase